MRIEVRKNRLTVSQGEALLTVRYTPGLGWYALYQHDTRADALREAVQVVIMADESRRRRIADESRRD